MTSYRQNILSLFGPLLSPLVCHTVLDFGCGDGWFSANLSAFFPDANITPLDVSQRSHCTVDPIIYDGNVIPFQNGHFDLVFAADVLHHCANPEFSITELCRCSNRFLALKDHTYASNIGWLGLSVLDELGNRRFGVPSTYNYQKKWAWVDLIESNGFRCIKLIHPAPVHHGLLGAITNHMQFIGLWERRSHAQSHN